MEQSLRPDRSARSGRPQCRLQVLARLSGSGLGAAYIGAGLAWAGALIMAGYAVALAAAAFVAIRRRDVT
jgi:hypothetical protein